MRASARVAAASRMGYSYETKLKIELNLSFLARTDKNSSKKSINVPTKKSGEKEKKTFFQD